MGKKVRAKGKSFGGIGGVKTCGEGVNDQRENIGGERRDIVPQKGVRGEGGRGKKRQSHRKKNAPQDVKESAGEG